MPSDSAASAHSTLDTLRQLIVDTFALDRQPQQIAADTPLFRGGIDLNSLQAIELLVQVEDRFAVRLGNMDWSIYEAQTVADLAGQINAELAGGER
jgi:acyl carrier protein